MSIFARLSELFSTHAVPALAGVVESLRTMFEGDPATRRRVAFSVAMIALSAKMAKADGVVTPDEVAAFEQIFQIPDQERANVARLYNLAKSDVAGYHAYAEKLSTLCGSGEAGCPVLEDILDGLFHIAKADGAIHDNELQFLGDVAEIFGLSETRFETLLARHVDLGDRDPYQVLGVARDAPLATIRSAWKKLVRDNHPDMLVARGLPEEFVRIGTERVAALNAAFDMIERQRADA